MTRHARCLLQVGVAALQWALVRFLVQMLIFGQSCNGKNGLLTLLQHGETEVRLAALSSMLECHKTILPEAATDLKACVTVSCEKYKLLFIVAEDATSELLVVFCIYI